MTFWKFIENKATETEPESVELRIEGDIVDDGEAWVYEWFGEPSASPNAFRDALSEHKGKDITVWIDSYGGSVFAGAGIYNSLKEHDGKVIAKIDKAMSAASVIAMAADEIYMSPVAMLMIHNPMTGSYGDMHNLRKTADVLDAVKESIINAYMAKTKKTFEEISSMMDDETWMSANVAVKNGFANGVLYDDEPLDVQNMKDFSFNRLSVVNTADKSIKQAIKLFDKPKNEENNETKKQKLLMELDLI